MLIKRRSILLAGMFQWIIQPKSSRLLSTPGGTILPPLADLPEISGCTSVLLCQPRRLPSDPDIFMFLINNNHALRTVDITHSIQFGLSIVHTAAIGLGRTSRISTTTESHTKRKNRWQEVVANIISLSLPDDLHHVRACAT